MAGKRVINILARRPEDGSIELLARVSVAAPGQPATLEVIEPRVRDGITRMLDEDVFDEKTGKRLSLADSGRFLNALLRLYRSSRFWAAEAPKEYE